MTIDPVFRSVGQALHVAFLMEILPPTSKGPTQLFIEDLQRRMFRLDPLPHRERTMNTAGLSPLELRGQCAMVRACVQDHLTPPERSAVWARYGHQRTRAAGVSGLADYLRPLCMPGGGEVMLAVTWGLYVPKVLPKDARTRRREWSIRYISEQYGVPRSTLHDAQRTVRHHAEHLERSAQDRLGVLFERTGLVGEPESDSPGR